MSEWISVEDRLPDSEEKVLAVVVYPNDNYRMVETAYYQLSHGTTYHRNDRQIKPWQANGHCQSHYDEEDEDYFAVTHWVHLPELPDSSDH